MRRFWKSLAPMACGGLTLGWLQAFGMVNFANLLAGFLAALFSGLVGAFLGAIPEVIFVA